jgi:predicted permease
MLTVLVCTVWSITYSSLSILIGYIVTRLLKLPPWVTPACAFNNTTSLPLLLLQSLESAGSLEAIIPEGQSVSDAIKRAQSYFLVCAVTTKTMSYALGPRMLRDIDKSEDDGTDEDEERGVEEPEPEHHPTEEEMDEETSLLPRPAQKLRHGVSSPLKRVSRFIFSLFPERVKQELTSVDTGFVDVAILCTVTGAVLGLVPKLHQAFFSPNDEGGIFNAWLTSSIENVGKLFTTLQMIMVGCKLGVSFEKMKRSKNSGKVPVRAILTVFLIRMVLWPA